MMSKHWLIRHLINPAIERLRRSRTRLSAQLERVFSIRPARALMYEQVRNLKRGLERRALEDTLDYIEEHMLQTPVFASRWALLTHAVELAEKREGLILEFGVAGGESINYIAARTARPVYGFDSFEGLPQDWGGQHRAGTFQQQERPSVRSNVTLVTGYYEITVPAFVTQHDGEPLSLLHVDCDLYESTTCVLSALGSALTPGALLLFDEYFNFPGWRLHEFRAWQEFCAAHGIRYTYRGFTERGRQVLISIVAIEPPDSGHDAAMDVSK